VPPRPRVPSPGPARSDPVEVTPVSTPPVVRRVMLPALGAVLALLLLAGCADKVSPKGKAEADRVTAPEL